MKRLIFGLLACLFYAGLYAQSERLDYYQHTKTVRANGSVENQSGNNGQFVKRTKLNGSPRCFDATSRGLDHLNGLLFYIGQNNSREVYEGKSYWGENSTYQFDDVNGYLNVKDAKGNVYVFRRTSAPSGRTRSSYIISGGAEDGFDHVAEWNKLQNGNSYSGSGSSGSSSSGSAGRSKSNSSSRSCSYCNGAKRIRAHVGTGGYGTSNKKNKCSTCGEWYYVTTDHWHACPHCK